MESKDPRFHYEQDYPRNYSKENKTGTAVIEFEKLFNFPSSDSSL